MKKYIVLLLGVALIAGTAWGKNFEVSKKADDLTVNVEIDKNPPVVGENNLSVAIKDASGKQITDAKVKVEYSMPPMPGMPPMNYKADAALKGDKYLAKLNFSMAGGWSLVVQVAQAEKVKKIRISVDVK